MTHPCFGGEVGGPPCWLNMPLAPQAGQAVLLQCGMFAALKSMVLPVTATFSVFHLSWMVTPLVCQSLKPSRCTCPYRITRPPSRRQRRVPDAGAANSTTRYTRRLTHG